MDQPKAQSTILKPLKEIRNRMHVVQPVNVSFLVATIGGEFLLGSIRFIAKRETGESQLKEISNEQLLRVQSTKSKKGKKGSPFNRAGNYDPIGGSIRVLTGMSHCLIPWFATTEYSPTGASHTVSPDSSCFDSKCTLMMAMSLLTASY